jgi:hypothetical protein
VEDWTSRRRQEIPQKLRVFDVANTDTDMLLTATQNKARLHSAGGVVHELCWTTEALVDAKLRPSAHAPPLALCYNHHSALLVPLKFDADVGGVTNKLPAPIWMSRDYSPFSLLYSNASSVILTGEESLAHLDLALGNAALTRSLTPPDGSGHMYSACHDPLHSPHEATVATRCRSTSLLYRVDFRCHQAWIGVHSTGHERVVRVRQGTTATVLTSHARSRDIEVWDLRKFAEVSLSPDSAGLCACADAHRCRGNAPDFACEDGILAAISGGSPGTTYGARLHIFSASPRRLTTECNLPEIIVDDGHRLNCPMGVKLTGRTLTLIADQRRVLQCSVP